MDESKDDDDVDDDNMDEFKDDDDDDDDITDEFKDDDDDDDASEEGGNQRQSAFPLRAVIWAQRESLVYAQTS